MERTQAQTVEGSDGVEALQDSTVKAFQWSGTRHWARTLCPFQVRSLRRAASICDETTWRVLLCLMNAILTLCSRSSFISVSSVPSASFSAHSASTALSLASIPWALPLLFAWPWSIPSNERFVPLHPTVFPGLGSNYINLSRLSSFSWIKCSRSSILVAFDCLPLGLSFDRSET